MKKHKRQKITVKQTRRLRPPALGSEVVRTVE